MISKSTPDLIGFDIVIEHNACITFNVIQDTVSILDRVAFEVSRKHIEYLLDRYPELGFQFAEYAYGYLENNKSRILWLESVESGSSWFKGNIVSFGALLAITFATAVFVDVLDKKKWYKEFINELDKATTTVAELVVEDFNKAINPQELPDDMKFEVKIVGDRVRIFVLPGINQKNIAHFDSPDI